ncbi:hypothetical protein [Achromobacter xylosoxidans]|jgi:hypothetical protein|uniref:hypothetical protein n=1 Tax=Alcaligenes xylosoxydans xylosoxydans TaxID=85698 RepID=UPI001F147A00|nr:hypothetical protein [Achromobacter xylosoxidans]
MADCEDCRAIVRATSGAAGHDQLISLGYVRSLAAVQGGARHEAFVCSACGAEWNYVHGKRAETAGWLRS